nr:ribonuclease H-like domain-containing protein [Tanacetum cinerariifolium]
MKMEHYLSHTDYLIWQVIQNGNGLVSITTDTNGLIKVLPPKTAKEVVARERERKARTTLLMALPKDHLAKFHKMADAKDMFQTLLSQLEIHGAGVLHEDANKKFLRSLPSSWSQVDLIMRTKPGLDTLSFDDLYNNLRTSNALHNAIMEAGGKDRPPMLASVTKGGTKTTTERYIENYKNVSQDIRDQLNAEAVKAIEMLKQGESINVQDLKTNLYLGIWKIHITSQQAATRNRGKAIINSPPPIYDQEPSMVTEDYEIANQDNSLRISKGTGYDTQRIVNVAESRETVGMSETKMGKGCSLSQGKDAIELEAPYMYMVQIQEVTPDAANNSGPIFDSEPLQKVSNNENYNVFAIESEYPDQSKSVNDTYSIEQDEHNVIIDSLDMSYDREQVDQDDDDDLANERDLLASLIEKLKCKIDDRKNHKFLETLNQVLVDKLQGQIEDFKTKNKSLESSNNHFKQANNELSKTNQLMNKDLKKFQAELDKYHDVKYASKVEIDCAKAKGDLMSYKLESEKSSNEYTQKINDLNQTISEMKKELFAHKETISIMSQQKEAQIQFYKTREDKEIDKFIALENKVKVLNNIVYKTGQSVQTMNMLNRNCKTSFPNLSSLRKLKE